MTTIENFYSIIQLIIAEALDAQFISSGLIFSTGSCCYQLLLSAAALGQRAFSKAFDGFSAPNRLEVPGNNPHTLEAPLNMAGVGGQMSHLPLLSAVPYSVPHKSPYYWAAVAHSGNWFDDTPIPSLFPVCLPCLLPSFLPYWCFLGSPPKQLALESFISSSASEEPKLKPNY